MNNLETYKMNIERPTKLHRDNNDLSVTFSRILIDRPFCTGLSSGNQIDGLPLINISGTSIYPYSLIFLMLLRLSTCKVDGYVF